jgi:hypothetical protein
MPQVNPKRTYIAVNGNAGAFVLVKCTITCSKVRVQEDPNYNAGVAQGLKGYYLDPNSPNVAVNDPTDLNYQQTWLPNSAGQVGPAYQPIEFGGDAGRVHGGEGNYVGAQGTPLLSLISASANATGIILEEWP